MPNYDKLIKDYENKQSQTSGNDDNNCWQYLYNS